MTAKHSSEISRRDALKLLGAAAGATVLANLPSKWSTPELTAGVLPAHAQTSCRLALRVFMNNTSVMSGEPEVHFFAPLTPWDASELVSGGTAAIGASVSWDNCGEPCILFIASISGGIGGAGFIVTVGDMDLPVIVINNGPGGDPDEFWIYVNAATGAFNWGPGTEPITPPDESCPLVL